MYQPYGYYVPPVQYPNPGVPVASTPSTSQPQPPRRERRCKVIITDPKDNNQLELDREKKTLTSSSDANSTAEITENVIDKSVGVVESKATEVSKEELSVKSNDTSSTEEKNTVVDDKEPLKDESSEVIKKEINSEDQETKTNDEQKEDTLKTKEQKKEEENTSQENIKEDEKENTKEDNDKPNEESTSITEENEDDWENQDPSTIQEKLEATQNENTTGKRIYERDFLMGFKDNKEKPNEMKDLSFLFGKENNKSGGGRQKNDKKNNNRNKRRKGGRNQAPPKPRPIPTLTEEETKIREANSILNKLVPETMQKLTKKLLDLSLSIELLKIVAQKIFEKALTEPKYCYMYAVLCDSLSHNGNSPEYRKEFRTFILGLCQSEFETRKKQKLSDDPQIREEEDYKLRLRMRGNMEFVGELYKRKVLSEKVVMQVLRQLVEIDPPVDMDIEAFCKLMTTVGPIFDVESNKEIISYIFNKLEELAKSEHLAIEQDLWFVI